MNADDPQQRALLDVPGLAAALNVSPDTVRRRAHAGDLPGYRIGRAWRFDLDEVLTALRTQREQRDPWARSAASRRALNRRRAW